MAGFDPSVIASIGDSAPDLAASQAKAYTLSDMIDSRQIRKGEMAKQASDAEDSAKVKQVLQSSDLSSYEGKLKAGEQITKINPKMGMDFQRETQQGRVAEGELTRQQYELYAAKTDIIGGAVAALKTEHDQLQNAGKNPAEINAAMMPKMLQTLQQLEAAKLPDGSPLLTDQNRQVYEQQLGKGYNPAFIDQLVAQSKTAREVITQKLAERKEDNTERHERTTEAQEAERERHDRTTENQSQQKITNAKEKFENQGFTSHQAELLAAMADANVSLPAGLRSQQQIKATIDGLYASHPDMSAAQITDGIRSGKLKLTAETSAARTAGTQIGRVSVAVNEIKPFGDQVLEASKDLPRGSANLTLNGLMQMAETQNMDPKLLVLRTKLQSLNNAYDQLAARGGTDKDKREHIHQLFDARLDDKNIRALVKAINEEGAGAKQAAESTIGEVSGTTLPGAQAGPSSATTAPPSATTAPGGATSTIPPPPPGFKIVSPQ